MSENELVTEHLLKMMGMPKRFISEASRECLDAAIDELHKTKEMKEFNEEFQKTILNSISLVFYTLVEVNQNQIDNTQSCFSRYRMICDGFMVLFSELHNKFLEINKKDEQKEVLQEK